jgi:hypothetical protein
MEGLAGLSSGVSLAQIPGTASVSDDCAHRSPPTGTFLIAFHFLGLLYAWGVIQADLSKRGLGGSQLLSLIGGLNAFFTAAFCLPVINGLDLHVHDAPV